MQTIRSVTRMQRLSRQLAAKEKTISLVPTMGSLHEGHLSLIRQAKKRSDIVIVSIFVNPAQFGPKEDLSRYPRNEKRDVRLIKSAGGDITFIPPVDEIYPTGFDTWVSVECLTDTLEGASRSGHFRGVTTVVAKLFNITRPDLALFGMKDFQQAVVLKQMSRDLGYPIKLIIGPTVREHDGLAMSTRNAYLGEQARWEAVCLYYALRSAREMVRAGIDLSSRITREMRAIILATCPSAEIEYIAITDFESLKPVKRVVANTICSLAAWVHGVRLIDNMRLR